MARSESKEEGLGEPIPYDPDFKGPLRNRSCTDVICLFLFIVFIGCWICVGIYAFTNGDPNTLLVPKDSSGRRCGLDESVKTKPYLFFFDLTKCLNPSVAFTGCPTKQVCVEACPDKNFIWDENIVPNQQGQIKDLICEDSVDKTTITNVNIAESLVNDKKCAKWFAKSSPFEKRCIPIIDKTFFDQIKDSIGATMETLTKSIQQLKSLTQAEQIGQNIVDDLVQSWWKILIGIGVAVLISIIYIVMMRWIAAIMVWLSLLGAIAILTFTTYLCAVKYIDLKSKPPVDNEGSNIIDTYLTKKDTWLVLLIISAIVLGIILLIVIFLRKRILLAIALVKEGSKAVSSVTSVLFFPVFPWVLQVGVIAYALAVGLFLSTTGNPVYKIRNLDPSCHCSDSAIIYVNDQNCKPEEFIKCDVTCGANYDMAANATCKFIALQNPELYPYMQAFNVFAFLWSAFFTSALGQMILASVFATWYWTFKKSNLPFFAVAEAALRTLRYHIGTLAFGSLIITICRAIRLVLEYIDHKLKKYDNEITKAILCCCKCFFWCLEKFLKFINRNAYIMCAIHGKNFCGSAKDAFLLLMRNIVRVFVLDKVTDFLFFLGKVLITVGVGSLAYLVFATDLTTVDNTGINYELVPVITIMIFTYLITSIFFSVYSMAVDTLFLCFLEDCERNDGSAEKPYYMSRNLMGIFGKKNKVD